MILLGRRQVQRWLQLLLYARLTPGNVFASPLLQLAATRGKFLELLAAGNKTLEDHGFLTGIMSLIDALLGVPLAEILDGLPVADEVRVALQGRHGKLGCMLTLAEALERGDPAPLNAAMSAAMAALPDCNAQRVNKAQLEALRWANSIAASA